MKPRNTILRLAVAAAFAGGAVGANAGLLQPGTSTAFTPAPNATELPVNGITLTATAAKELSAGAVTLGFAPSSGQNLLIAVSLNNGAKFAGAPSVMCSNGSTSNSAVLNLGGAGQTNATFTVGQSQLSGTISSCFVSATGLTVTGAHSDVALSITYTYGTLSSSTDGGNYVHFQDGLTATRTAGADVVALVTGGFTTVSAALNASGTIVSAGQVNWGGNTSAMGPTDLATPLVLGDAMGASSGSITVAGAALAATKTGTGSSAGIWLISAGGSCATTGAGSGIASAVGGQSSVTFTGLTPAQMTAGLDVCLQFTGTTAVQAGSITAQVSGTALTNYSLPSPAALTLMNITRNGTQLIAPLVQIPSGFLSRMVIMNTGPAADYTVSTVSETGTTATPTGTAASGTVPANGLTVVDLPSNLTITSGQPQRTSFSITVNGTNTNVNGLYQIVDPSGAVSNYVMVKQ